MRCAEQTRSFNGVRIFKALDRERLLSSLLAWAAEIRRCHPEVLRIGLFGSYARGDYSPGSDADLLVLVRQCEQPCWFLRALAYDTASLPVGVDLLVYTAEETRRLNDQSRWFGRVLSEVVWLC
jgi:predicted nucleotidyltransferase